MMLLVIYDANPPGCDILVLAGAAQGSEDKLKVILQFEKLQSINRSMELL